MFFTQDNKLYKEPELLKRVCNNCVVKDECLDYALHHAVVGWWGGTSEKTIWVGFNIWGERGEKLKPFITKGTYIVVEGSGGVNAYTQKNGEPAAVINCRVTSLEFGGKPTAEPTPHTAPPTGKVTFEGVDGDLPF